jgi:hypothetical protein
MLSYLSIIHCVNGEDMPYCPNCGKEVSNEMNVCPSCGGVLSSTDQPAQSEIRATTPVQTSVAQKSDLLSLISVGVVIMLIGLTYYRYTVDLSLIRNYIENMAASKVFIKPPTALIDPMIFLFSAAGIWGIILSGLRLLFEKNVRKAFGDLFGGFFAFFTTYLLTSYGANAFTEQIMGAYFIVAIGVLIVANSLIYLVFPIKGITYPNN